MELAQWLHTQVDEDERIVQAASWADEANAWHAAPSPYDTWGKDERWYVEDAMEEGLVTHVDPKASDDEGVARHIAEWDPARVLREIDAKRQLLALHRPVQQRSTGSGGGTIEDCQVCGHFPAQYPCVTLRLLALPYADRPGYREEWRP
ncbi:DUF6221 family protein [Streptomyces lincolnensis]|uniref:DUF6221 family protein n=1 Tax=Streptomyces lincolnensis TaxID=1915 RepID=UPI001E380320|nr:DUF6221 family protein [Streptomyces lincolnensis]MCD7440252.1 DUF6221 family protein [Streptomyces lincolnensis]